MTSAAGPSNAFNFNGQGPAIGGRPCDATPGTRQHGQYGWQFVPTWQQWPFDHILSRLQQKSHETGAEAPLPELFNQRYP